MLSPFRNNEPKTRPAPPTSQARPSDAAFERQRAERDIRIRQEQLADERVALATERRALAREKQEWEEQQEQRTEQQHAERREERRIERRTAEAEHLAGDLAHDVNVDRPGFLAARIIEAGLKARGLSGIEGPTGQALEILNAGRVARGEIAATSDTPTNPVARATLLCGAKARGETLSEADASFLTHFLETRYARR
jgi:hypothetical protein